MPAVWRGLAGAVRRLVPREGRSDTDSSYLRPDEDDPGAAGARRPARALTGRPLSPASSGYSEDDLGAPARAPAEPLELPRFVWHANPRVALKLRKRFYPLGVTRLTLGADLDVQTRDVRLKWSWKDRFIGGRLRFEGSQLSLSKRFDVDARTHMYVRVAFDVHARRALLSLDVKPFRGLYATGDDRPPGLALKQKVPIDKRVTMEVLARIQLPEARFSTQNTVSLGDGDFVVDVEQLNFKFMLQ